MIKRLVALALLTLLMLLSSCTEGTVISSRDGEEASLSGSPDDWVTIGKDYPYIRLENIHPLKIPEIKVKIDMESGQGQLEPLGDGFVYLTMKPAAEGLEESELKKPLARKYDKTGKLVWEKKYEYSTNTGFISNLVICSDNGFLFTVQTNPRNFNGMIENEKSLIVRCASNGETLWKHELDDYSGNMVKNAVLTKNEEICIVGTGRVKNGVQTKEDAPDTIAITKLDPGGNLLEQKWFGGSDFDYVYSAVYKKAAGLILWGSSQSHDGDFAIDKEMNHNDFIACINSSLELLWVFQAGMNRGFNTVPSVSEEGEVNILGSIQETGSKPKGLLIKLDREGKTIWEKQAYDDYWGCSVNQAANGDILIAKGYGESGMIAVVGSDGNEKMLLEGLEFYPTRICPVESGGFIVTATRNVGYLPQPPFISSIWYDTELVAEKYGSEYKIEWRKTYDRYKNQRGTDLAWPQPDGSLVVPR